MAASKKSTVLGLCLWEGTDKPRRVDFVADNEAIESQLGGHIQNDNLHLNDTRRKRLDTPTEVRTYTGTGAASRTILFGFSPSAVIVFAVDKPFSQATTGCTKQYAGIAADGQNSLGVTLSTAGDSAADPNRPDRRQRYGIAERKRRNVRGVGVQIRRYIIFREENIISNKERYIIKKRSAQLLEELRASWCIVCNFQGFLKAVADRLLGNPCNRVPYDSIVHWTIESTFLVFGEAKGFHPWNRTSF